MSDLEPIDVAVNWLRVSDNNETHAMRACLLDEITRLRTEVTELQQSATGAVLSRADFEEYRKRVREQFDAEMERMIADTEAQ